jgi:hypothetical protein
MLASDPNARTSVTPRPPGTNDSAFQQTSAMNHRISNRAMNAHRRRQICQTDEPRRSDRMNIFVQIRGEACRFRPAPPATPVRQDRNGAERRARRRWPRARPTAVARPIFRRHPSAEEWPATPWRDDEQVHEPFGDEADAGQAPEQAFV